MEPGLFSSDNFFSNLSYYEFCTKDGFISRFPSGSTVCTKPLKSPIRISTTEYAWYDKFDEYFTTLATNNLGIFDIFWWLPDISTTVCNPQTLLRYISNTLVIPLEVCQKHQKVKIVNTLVPGFEIDAYFTTNSLPGEAIDVVPVFVDGFEQYTAIGRKKESPRIGVTLSSGKVIRVLTVGIYGNVIFGEHLNPDEKASLNNLRDEFFSRNQQKPVVIDGSHEPSSAIRTLAEEFGLKNLRCARSGYVDYSITLPTEQPCRDPRYGIVGPYGYGRISIAHTLCCIFECSPPSDPIPLDMEECDKPRIVLLRDAVENFKAGMKYSPAFPSHEFQFAKAAKFARS